ncbi:hypothetical protein [Streptomyces sp. 4F14]|uniref:hypothetical protein n=1 Tax=Streptomyces sp. 4F14 TaxID=3394380 RepID=UPI003A85D07A
MTTEYAADLATESCTAGRRTVAVIAPQHGCGYANALARRGRGTVAVVLSPTAGPPAHWSAALDGRYTDVIEYTGDPHPVAARLRAAGTEAVMPASPAGVELAEKIAWKLGLPGSGAPRTALLRTDHGAQAEALSQAGIAAPRTLCTTSLAEALAWTRSHRASAYRLASPCIGVPAGPAEYVTRPSITAVWPQAQQTALRLGGDNALVIQERVPGRQYVICSATRSGPGGPQHTVTDIWAHAYAPTGLLDRIDLLHRYDLLARRLSLHTHRVLDALGVASGPAVCHVAFDPDRGPVLLSAGVVTHRSLGDEATWALTGHDPIDMTLDTTPRDRRRGTQHRRVTRIRLTAPLTSTLGSNLLPADAELPTTVCIDAHPDSFIPGTEAQLPDGRTFEIVLAHEEPEAIERDCRRIHALAADLHRIRHR